MITKILTELINTVIKEETRKRCAIVKLDDDGTNQFTPIRVEQFHLLREVKSIDFSIYVRIENYAIEYIKKEELCKEYLDQIWNSLIKSKRSTDICILKSDFDLFQKLSLLIVIECLVLLNHF